MRKVILPLTPLLLLVACVSSPLPDGYTGPTAIVRDSAVPYDTTKADFFWVESVDGRKIETSPTKTMQVNHGRGLYMEPQVIERSIPAQKVQLMLYGSTVYAADILALMHKTYSVSGMITIDARQGATYVVRGKLGPVECSVWLEDAASGAVVGEKITKRK